MQPYKEMMTSTLIYFDEYEIDNIPRDRNMYDDAMASSASLSPINKEDEETILIIKKHR